MVREFSFKDLDRVNELLSELKYSLDEKSFDNDFLKVLLYDDGIIKGVLVYQNLIDRLTIDYIIVDSKYRNEKIATKLIEEMEKTNSEALNATLEVKESNKIAISFYEKNGFKKAAIRKNYYGIEDGILMIKEYR